ncbi:MAG: hypothetical protein DMG13_26585 [Acidobacteria bacterium]|nr:MAG: hypothetical protein DMG13_26585 [Acidobacteriota bacterium]
MRTQVCAAVAGLNLLLASVPVAAHHAFAAEFDVDRPVKVRGTVTKVEWVNPHAWLYVDVKDPDGSVVNWRFELGAPNSLFRLGWKKDTIPTGLQVEITGFRDKAGGSVARPGVDHPEKIAACSDWETRERHHIQRNPV